MSNSKRTQYIVSDAWQTSEPFEEDPDIRKGDRLLLRIWYFEVTGWININSTHEDDDVSCAICLENFSDISDSLDDRHDQKLILRLPCSHLYHRHCMAGRLLTSHSDCPVCQDRVPIVGAGRERLKRLQFSVGQYPTPIAPVSEPEPEPELPSKPLWLQMVDKPHLGRPDKVKLRGCRCYVNC